MQNKDDLAVCRGIFNGCAITVAVVATGVAAYLFFL